MWTWLPPRNTCFSLTCVAVPSSVHSSSNRTSVIVEICRKIFDSHAPPIKVTQAHWNRHRPIGYFLLVVFYSKYGSISYRFRDIWRFLLKNAIFQAAVYLTPLLREFSLKFCNCGAMEKWKTLSTILPDSGKCLIVHSFRYNIRV